MGQPLGILFVVCGLIIIVRDSRDWLRAVRRPDVAMSGVIDDDRTRSCLDRLFDIRAVRIFVFHPVMIVFGAWAVREGATA